MKQVTQWSPDTCGCVLKYEWDDAIPLEQRELTVSEVVTRCKHHQAMKDEEHFGTVLEENQRKNLSVAKVKDVHPDAEVDWKYDDKRNLVLDVKNVSFLDPDLSKNLGDKVQVKTL